MPSPNTWQFNFKFSLTKEKHNPQSIRLLIEAGIDFKLLEKKGIDFMHFAD
jgi:hypothetical protein